MTDLFKSLEAQFRKCDLCGKFHEFKPGSEWQMIYSGGPIPMPDHEITRCADCVERYGSFVPQAGIKPEYSCGKIDT